MSRFSFFQQTSVQPLSLSFPNRSRSYDVTRRAVRFWGHEGAIEHQFFVHEDALARFTPETSRDELVLLSAFDRNRDQILRAANAAFRRGRAGVTMLTTADF